MILNGLDFERSKTNSSKSEQDLKKEEEEREQKELNPTGGRKKKDVHYGEGRFTLTVKILKLF